MKMLNDYLRETFGMKVYKIALNGGFTCPNRDGTIGTGGCIFCSAGGSGEFAEDASYSIREQIERGKARVALRLLEKAVDVSLGKAAVRRVLAGTQLSEIRIELVMRR